MFDVLTIITNNDPILGCYINRRLENSVFIEIPLHIIFMYRVYYYETKGSSGRQNTTSFDTLFIKVYCRVVLNFIITILLTISAINSCSVSSVFSKCGYVVYTCIT